MSIWGSLYYMTRVRVRAADGSAVIVRTEQEETIVEEESLVVIEGQEEQVAGSVEEIVLTGNETEEVIDGCS